MKKYVFDTCIVCIFNDYLIFVFKQTAFLAVTVYIEDINDHYPQFQNVPYEVNVDESTPVGTTIFQGISAFDRDKPNTPNSDVQFSLGADTYPGGPYFALESPHRPSLVLRRQLDYDDGSRQFTVPIVASVNTKEYYKCPRY